MEVTKEIKFEQTEILKNTTVTLIYSGKLIKNDSDKIYVVYGFNAGWDNTSKKEMLFDEGVFKVDIDLYNNDSLNFCFKNSNNEWDNNENNDYVVQIKEPNTSMIFTPVVQRPKLRKTYIWKKKIKLATYKAIISFPKFITENYKKRFNQ